MMNETSFTFLQLIRQCAEDTGAPEDQVRPALTAALGLFDKHAGKDELAAFYGAVAGTEAQARSQEARPRPAGLLGGVLKNAGGLSGATIADGMGFLNRMSRLGIQRSSLRKMLSSARKRIKAATGRDLLGDVLHSMPGVSALLGDR